LPGATGSGIGLSARAVAKRGSKVFTYSTSAQRSSSLSRYFHGGMPVPLAPREMVRNRSSSVGNWPPAVVLNLNWPAVKSRGGGTRNGAP
jgi:hypothetical protein